MPLLNKLLWIEELLPQEVTTVSQRGGRSYYFDDRLILTLIETGTSYEHKGITYPFQIWNGCFFAVEKIKQNTVYAKFQFLENHPVLKESLYLPADSENFSEQVWQVLREIKKGNPLFGLPIKKLSKSKSSSVSDDLDTSTPKTFSDVPRLKKTAKKGPQKPKEPPLKKAKVSKKNDNDFLLAVLKRKNNKS